MQPQRFENIYRPARDVKWGQRKMKREKTIMRKFLVIAITAMLMACSGQEPVSVDDNFKFYVNNVTDRQASIKVTPIRKDAYYYWDILTPERYVQLKDTIGEYYFHLWEEELNSGLIYEENEDDEPTTIEDYMYKGTDSEPEFDGLLPETEYVLFAYYPDKNFHAAEISKYTFKTASPQMLEDVKIWFIHQQDKLLIGTSLGGEIIFCCCATSGTLKNLNLSITEYAEQLLKKCAKGEESIDKYSGVSYFTVDYPSESTEYCACLVYGTARISEWFTHKAP